MKQIKTTLSKYDIIKQANSLNTAAYSLTRNEKRLVYLAIHSINRGESKQTEFGAYPIKIKHSEYASIFDEEKENNSYSREIKSASLSLNKKNIIFYIPSEDSKDEKALDALSWTVKASHRPKRGETIIHFNAELISIIKSASSNFTRILVSDIKDLERPSAMRLYDSLRQWEQKGEVTFTILNLVDRYLLPEKYLERLSDFRRRFLHPAVKEINEKTELKVKAVEVTKKGERKPYAIIFKINKDKNLPTKVNSLEDAVCTFLDIMERKRIPNRSEVDNLKHFSKQLIKDGFEYNSIFIDLLTEVESRIEDIENTVH